jgi:hypothetical protein
MKINQNLNFVLTIGLASFIYFEFLAPNKYTSEVILKIKEEENENNINSIPFGLPNLSTGLADKSLYTVKKLMESESMFQNKLESINTLDLKNQFFGNFFDLSNLVMSYEDRVKQYQRINIDDNSQTITFFSTAFSAEGAFRVNMINLEILNNYFDLKKIITSELNVARTICELDIKNLTINNNFNQKAIAIEADNILDIGSGIDLMLEKINKVKNDCLANIENSREANLYSGDLGLPELNLNNLVNESKNFSTDKIINSLIRRNFISDKIEIVSDISLPTKADKKRSIIYTLICIFLFTILRFVHRITIKILRES